MARKLLDGVQDFSKFMEGNYFYVDKTGFISEWWLGEIQSDVSLITRPRRFGKTLLLSTVEQFFSIEYADRADMFKDLTVWKDEEMRALQGSWPVIFLSLADVKGSNFATQRALIIDSIVRIYRKYENLGLPDLLSPGEQNDFFSISRQMDDATAFRSLNSLCMWLERMYRKKVMILLDEYDTPLHEAWLRNFWKESADFFREFFNSTFKSNPYLQRAILTGITRVSRESIFSDMNNLRFYSITTPRYTTSFGFTEAEVFAAMDEYGLTERKAVKAMYDGYIFGGTKEIYNPWSVVSYLQDPRLETWWANTSSNAMVGKLIREGDADLKLDCQTLIKGGSILSEIDEQIVFERISGNANAVWSLLLASGYLKPVKINGKEYELQIVNEEVRQMFDCLIKDWFAETSAYKKFLKALMRDDLDEMNEYMNDVALNCFSSFDTGGRAKKSDPEGFYHGFVLGLLVDLRDRYILTSNRESGSGRYDVMLEPRNPATDPAFIFEFKVHKPDRERSIQATVAAALAQIEEKGYAQQLLERGIPASMIRKYGFAFKGKQVLIG